MLIIFRVNRIIFLLLLLFPAACISYKKYQQQEVLSQKLDANGKLTAKTFRQWISHPAGDRLATITQEFDSLGRVRTEYGFNNPYYSSQKYLVEKLYRGSQVYVLNKYLWSKEDTTGDFSNYDKQLYEEFIYPDSLNRHKSITISLWPKNADTLNGYFNETFPVSTNSWENKSYSFVLTKHHLALDTERKLILTHIIKK